MPYTLRTGRHPHEVALLLAAFLIGVTGLAAFDKVSTTSIRALPMPYGYVLYAGLVLTSAVALFGVFRRTLVGILIERAGLIGMSGLLLVFSIVVWANNNSGRATGFVVFSLAFAAANAIRVWQTRREVQDVKAATTLLAGSETKWSG